MPDEKTEGSSPKLGTYRSCRYCDMYILSSLTHCPECGANQDTNDVPSRPVRYTFLPALALILILAAVFVVLSRDKEAARDRENAYLTRLQSDYLVKLDWGSISENPPPSNPKAGPVANNWEVIEPTPTPVAARPTRL